MDSTYGGLTRLDWTVVVGYFVGITAFGLWICAQDPHQRRLLPRRPEAALVGHDRAGVRHGHQCREPGGPGRARRCQSGFATIWYQWKNMLITPFYWLMAPWYRRSERTTDRRDHRGPLRPRAWPSSTRCSPSPSSCSTRGPCSRAPARSSAVATGGKMISPNEVVVAMTVAFILYSFFGGLIASAYTDFIQGFLIIVLSFMLIPMGLAEVGGFAGMREALPANFFELYNEVSGVDVFTIVMLTLNGLVGITAQPHILIDERHRAKRAGGPDRPDLRLAGQAVLHDRLGPDRSDRRRAWSSSSGDAVGRSRERLRLRLPAPAGAGLDRADGGLRPGGQHVDLLELHGQHRRAVHAKLLQDLSRPRRQATARSCLSDGVSGLALTLLGVLFALMVENVLQALPVHRDDRGADGHHVPGRDALEAGQPLRRRGRNPRGLRRLLRPELPGGPRDSARLHLAGGAVRLGRIGGVRGAGYRQPAHAAGGSRADRGDSSTT